MVAFLDRLELTVPMRAHATHHKLKRGFSLAEMLCVVAVVGCIAGMAAFNLVDVTDVSAQAKSKRNAQSLVQLYQSARAVGVVFHSRTAAGILDELIAGKSGTGRFATSRFQLPLSEDEKEGTLGFCEYDQRTGMLKYNVNGGE